MHRAATALATLAVLVGCGEETVASPGEPEPAPVANPYDGPMHLEPDYSDNASVVDRSGAAGRALECEGEPYNGGGGDYVDGGLESVQGSPQEALVNWLEEASWGALPESPYRVERDDGDRVLLSYDVGDKTKIAFIAASGTLDYNDDTGWGIESWAQCDPAELPEDVAEALGYEVWEDASGARIPVAEVRSSPGPEHCDWQDITFLNLGADDRNVEQYVRDTDGEFADWTTTRYDGAAVLPEDATDTGFHREGRGLWLGTRPDAAYLVSLDDPADVERWPAAREQIACG
jgi:hypothetical protein